MRKIYIFLTLICSLNVVASAQTTITTIYATNGATYKSGYASSTAGRASGNLRSGGTATGTQYRGYATFNLSTIPAGTVIDSCVVGIYITALSGTGTPGANTTYGYSGDLSTVTAGATLYADCIAGVPINTVSYGTTIDASVVLPSTTAATSFINSNIGSDAVSICFTGGTPRRYTIEGYAGTATLTGAHRPYITVQYCTGVTSVTATASTTSLCSGTSLALTGAGSGITSYLWTGPGSFTSTLESPTFTTTNASSGVYTFTAYNSGGCATSVTTATVNVSPAPTSISGTPSVCQGGSTVLSDSIAGGTWASATLSVATISSTGDSTALVTSVLYGTSVISYSNTCGTATLAYTVNPNPSPIAGSYTVCQGAVTSLSSAPGGGGWASSATSVATVNSTTGAVTGIMSGTATITYTLPTTCFITTPLQVQPAPGPITGTPNECVGATTALSDAITGGVWSSSNVAIASISASGVVTGLVSQGTVTISYSNFCGVSTLTDNVLQSPFPITGRDSVCAQSTTLLSDAVSGGTWTSSNTSLASVPATPTALAVTGGISGGSATITYTLPSSCYAASPFTVVALPAPIIGPASTCPNMTIPFADLVSGGSWSSDNSFVAIIGASGLLTGVSPDTVTINYTLPFGCFVSKTILVNPLPAPISGTSAFCEATQDTLTDDSLGGVWNSGSPSVAVISPAGVLTGISGGTAIITYTLPTGCFATVSELVHPSPLPVITFNYADGTFSTDSGLVSYQWYDGPYLSALEPITGATSYHLAAVYNNYYTVLVTDSFGCTDLAVPFDLTNVGVKNISNNNKITIYPNPATSRLYITAPVNVSAIITDVAGKIILQQANVAEMDIHNLPNGVYMIALYNGNNERLVMQKLVKE